VFNEMRQGNWNSSTETCSNTLLVLVSLVSLASDVASLYFEKPAERVNNLFGDSDKFLALGRRNQAVRGLLDSGKGNDEVDREHQRKQRTDNSAGEPGTDAENSATDVGEICWVAEERNNRVESFLNI
jgi:hypothetical protein